MRSINLCLFTKFGVLFLLIGSAAAGTPAQNLWLDTIPAEQVGCVKGQGKIESVDFGKSLRENARAAGAIEIGYPFLTKANPIGNEDGSMDWEACAIYKGPLQTTSGFEEQTLSASPGAFNLCEGTDVKKCSDALVAWIRTKNPDFHTLPRLIPLFAYSNGKLEATKQSVSTLVSQTFPISGDETASKVPEPAGGLDEQLYGPPSQPRQPRPLLTSQLPAPLDIAKKGGEQHYNAILAFVAVSEAQKTALGAP